MKYRIKTNCAACAYKHLTAAYAGIPSQVTVVDMSERTSFVYIARASIALLESINGYPAHVGVAVGCLFLAELANPELAPRVRKYRQEIDACATYRDVADLVTILISRTKTSDMFFANIEEAVRELPLLTDMLPYRKRTCEEWEETLVNAIEWLVDTYELQPEWSNNLSPTKEEIEAQQAREKKIMAENMVESEHQLRFRVTKKTNPVPPIEVEDRKRMQTYIHAELGDIIDRTYVRASSVDAMLASPSRGKYQAVRGDDDYITTVCQCILDELKLITASHETHELRMSLKLRDLLADSPGVRSSDFSKDLRFCGYKVTVDPSLVGLTWFCTSNGIVFTVKERNKVSMQSRAPTTFNVVGLDKNGVATSNSSKLP